MKSLPAEAVPAAVVNSTVAGAGPPVRLTVMVAKAAASLTV